MDGQTYRHTDRQEDGKTGIWMVGQMHRFMNGREVRQVDSQTVTVVISLGNSIKMCTNNLKSVWKALKVQACSKVNWSVPNSQSRATWTLQYCTLCALFLLLFFLLQFPDIPTIWNDVTKHKPFLAEFFLHFDLKYMHIQYIEYSTSAALNVRIPGQHNQGTIQQLPLHCHKTWQQSHATIQQFPNSELWAFCFAYSACNINHLKIPTSKCFITINLPTTGIYCNVYSTGCGHAVCTFSSQNCCP